MKLHDDIVRILDASAAPLTLDELVRHQPEPGRQRPTPELHPVEGAGEGDGSIAALVAAAAPSGRCLDDGERPTAHVGAWRSGRGSGRRRWALAVAAAAVLAVGGFAVATMGAEGDGQSVETTATGPTPGGEVADAAGAPTPVPTVVGEDAGAEVELRALAGGPWLVVPDDAGVFAAIEGPSSRPSADGSTMTAPGATRVNDFVRVGSEVWAFGQVGAPFQAIPGAWRSLDGRSWDRVVDDVFGEFEDDLGEVVSSNTSIVAAAERGGVIVAAGEFFTQTASTAAGAPVLWQRGAEGKWQRIEVPLAVSEPTMLVTVADVSATATGFVLAAVDNADTWTGAGNRMLLWHSADGETWTSLDSDAVTQGDSIRRFASDGDVTVAIGSRGGFAGDPAAWWSSDGGLTWTDADIAGGDNVLRYGEMVDVIATADGFVAVGHHTSQHNVGIESGTDIPGGTRLIGDADLALWTSVDGRTWTEAPSSAINAADRLDFGVALAQAQPTGVVVAADTWSTAGAGVTTLAGDPTALDVLAHTQPFAIGTIATSPVRGELIAGVWNPPPAFGSLPGDGPTAAQILLLPGSS